MNRKIFRIAQRSGLTNHYLLLATALLGTFLRHGDVCGNALTAENPVGFVAALNTTFVAAIVLCVVGVFTSVLRGAAKPA